MRRSRWLDKSILLVHRLPASRLVAGNRVELLVDGVAAYPRMLQAICAARRSIVLEVYTFNSDATGERFREALCERARAGVAVRVCIDGIGSLGVSERFFAPIVQAGGRFAVFRPPKPWRPAWGLWHRNHHKLLVVDDAVGFIGGLNIANAYAPTQWGGGGWHDVHAVVTGPAARRMTVIANRTWRRMTGEDWNVSLAPPAPAAGDVAVQVLESRLRQRFTIRAAYLRAINNAKRRICITNAYFIPDWRVRAALRRARARGVRVQLLLAGATDVAAVRYATRALYKKLLGWGVEIYEWEQRVLHAKTAVIDGLWCSIGSFNLDRRSLLHNLEANIAFVDAPLGGALETLFDHDLTRSRGVDAASWHRRGLLQKLLERLCYGVRYLL